MNTPAAATPASASNTWQRDGLAILIIIAVYALGVWLMPFAHNFAVFDDWSYRRAVEGIVQGQGYKPPEWAQMTLVFQVYWGALFAWLFGYSFTSLTAATMVLSLIGAISFYLLLRQVGLAATWSGLGVAILVFTPQYLTLSYSFMTDVPFFTLLTLSSLLYIKGLAGEKAHWLWLGSFVASLAFLTRQFGLALPLAATLYLLYLRQATVRRLLAVWLLPLLSALAYFLWRRAQPVTLADSIGQQLTSGWLQAPFDTLTTQLLLLFYILPALGLALPLFYPAPRRLLFILWLAVLGAAVYPVWQSNMAAATQPGSRAFPVFGPPFHLNVSIFWWLGVVLSAAILAWLSAAAWQWGQGLRPRRNLQPADYLYLLAAILVVGTFLTSFYGFLERYYINLYPALIVAALLALRRAQRWRIWLVGVSLLIVAAYSITFHLDDYDFYTAQWQAADWAIQQGVGYDQLDAGFAWDGYYLFDEAIRRLDSRDYAQVGFAPDKIIDRRYLISIRPRAGYRMIAQFPYFSRLDGWTTRQVMVLQRQ